MGMNGLLLKITGKGMAGDFYFLVNLRRKIIKSDLWNYYRR